MAQGNTGQAGSKSSEKPSSQRTEYSLTQLFSLSSVKNSVILIDLEYIDETYTRMDVYANGTYLSVDTKRRSQRIALHELDIETVGDENTTKEKEA